jgi:response regulator RpfG family c-di-GMP phosphodiesterase
MLTGHELVLAESLAQAEQVLSDRKPDLICCTVVFDESRMFDLLRVAKAKPEWRSIPFLCTRVRSHVLRSAAARRNVAFTCGALGAEAFLDLADYKTDPEREMRAAIESFLDDAPRRAARSD